MNQSEVNKMTIDERARKFLAEHPEYTAHSASQLKRLKTNEFRRVQKAQRIKEILELREKKDLTLKEIADRFGVSHQAIGSMLRNRKKE